MADFSNERLWFGIIWIDETMVTIVEQRVAKEAMVDSLISIDS